MRKYVQVGLVSLGLFSGASAFAQGQGGGGAGGLGGALVTPGGGLVGAGTGGGATGGGVGGGTGVGGGNIVNPAIETPTITGLAATAPAGGSVVSPSNPFAVSYANVLFAGRPGAAPNTAPGGFGTILFGTAGGGAGGGGAGGGGLATGIGTGAAGGFGATAGGFGGQAGGFGGAGGLGGGRGGLGGGRGGLGGLGGGLGGRGGLAGAQVVPLPRQIAYTATFRFPVAQPTMPQMVSNARAVLDRSTMLPNPQGIDLQSEGTVLVLRGTVASEDDARLAENMLRLTPGVRDIRNELQYPTIPQP